MHLGAPEPVRADPKPHSSWGPYTLKGYPVKMRFAY